MGQYIIAYTISSFEKSALQSTFQYKTLLRFIELFFLKIFNMGLGKRRKSKHKKSNKPKLINRNSVFTQTFSKIYIKFES